MLDEPANGLDPAGIRDKRALVKRLTSSGLTVLLSSHHMEEVEEICDDVTIMRRGVVVFHGTIAEAHSIIAVRRDSGAVLAVTGDPRDLSAYVASLVRADSGLLEEEPTATLSFPRALPAAAKDVTFHAHHRRLGRTQRPRSVDAHTSADPDACCGGGGPRCDHPVSSPRDPGCEIRRTAGRAAAGGTLLPAYAVGAPSRTGSTATDAARTAVASRAATPGKYHNPLAPTTADGRTVDSCADPTVIAGRRAQLGTWYMYCTTDPLDDADTAGRPPGGPTRPTFHSVPTMSSTDLVHWSYVGDALPGRPTWAAPGSSLWAPDVVWSRTYQRYYMSFVVTDTADALSGEPGCTSDSAIGVATSTSPTGPWTISETPLVAPRRAGTGCDFFWTYDPDVLGSSIEDTSVLYYGSYYGGVFAQDVRLSPTGMARTGRATQVAQGQRTEPAVDPARLRQGTQMHLQGTGRSRAAIEQAAIGNRYEGTNVVQRRGWYYLFASASNCCNGPLTGYTVFAGRSRSPFGPFLDREGQSLMAGRVGGTPVLSMNGNRWIGTGHNTVFRDSGGRWWTIYHAVDRDDPYFADQPGFTKRPALLDPLDWSGGWPSVRSGRWASDRWMPAPAARPGQRSAYIPKVVAPDRTGKLLEDYSDSFSGSRLKDRWTWVREPALSTYAVRGGRFAFATQAADLNQDVNTASVLTERAPRRRDYVVQTKVRLDVPASGCCFNFVQAGLVVYGSDDSFVKLAHVSIFETRQTEFAEEVPVRPGPDLPRYGNTVVGPPGNTTWLRIVKRTTAGHRLFTAYTSRDGRAWVRGGTWQQDQLGSNVRIGLVSMGGAGYTAHFGNVQVWALR